jgi:DNA-binding transcriptional regulator YiaG
MLTHFNLAAMVVATRQHGSIPALPFCHVRLTAAKTKTCDPVTLGEHIKGEHIKKERLDRHLTQGNAAALLPVKERTLSLWESGKRTPPVKYWPAIMGFLGYCPYQAAHTLGERLRLHRMHRGLSHRSLGRMLGIDPGSLSRWETDERRPDRRSRDVIGWFQREDASLATYEHASIRG